MKNFEEINRTPLGVKKNDFKSIVRNKARWLLTLIAILTLGVGQMWGDSGEFYNMYITYAFEGVDGSAEDKNDTGTGLTKDLGTLTSGSLTLTSVYLKCWDDWGSSYKSGGGLLGYVNKGSSAQELLGFTRTGKSGNNYEYKNTSPGLTIASYNQASGSFTFECWGKTYGDNWGDRYFPTSSGRYILKYKIAPPAVSSISVSPSNKISGTGTSGDPYIIAYGSSSTLTVTATKHHTDANSSLYVDFGSGYSSTNTKSVTPNGTKQSITINCKYYNSTATLSGAVSSTTIYYIEQTPGITVVAGDHGKVKKAAGDSWASSATISSVAASTAYNIYAQADSHYDFDEWTTDDGTHSSFANAESASTTVTLSAGYSAVTTVTANFVEHPYTITIVGGTTASANAGISTTIGQATANPPFGKRFSSWTKPATNFTLVGGTTTSSSTIKFNATANGTVTANFAQNHAYIEGRMTVYNSARTSETHVGGSSGAWSKTSTSVKMEYDNTNHRFYRHTYKTPAELSAQQSSEYQWFAIKTSTADGSLSNPQAYEPSSNQEMTTAGSSYKKTVSAASTDKHIRFNSSNGDSYAIIYFDGTGVWYELEQTLKYNGNGNTGGSAPAGTVYYDKGTNATAASNTYTRHGYTFTGWNTEANGSGSSYAASASVSMNSNITLYAQWSENKSDITLIEGSNGSITTPGDISEPFSLGVATKKAIVAEANEGYYFTGWTCTGVAVVDDPTSASTYATTNGTNGSVGTITANFARKWVLAGDWLKPEGVWDVTTNTMAVSTIGKNTYADVKITGLAANKTYQFKLYDKESGTHWVGYASDSHVYEYEDDSILVNTYPGYNISLTTAGQGDYRFTYNLKTHKLRVSFPFSRRITMGTRTISDGITSAYTGGTISAEDERDNVITTGLYILRDDDITFTASPKAGYIWRGWYDAAGCAAGDLVATERVHTDADVTSDLTRYGLFEEALYKVKVHLTDATEVTKKVGVDTHPEITAGAAPDGKIFDRWETTGSATVADPYASTTTITSATDDASTVTATFKELPKIYIDMTAATGWNPSKMYVVFYKNGGYFNSDNGTGTSSTYVINATPLEMTRMGTSKIWYYSYDPTSGDFAGQTITCVAFVDQTFAANYGNFTSATVVYRTDFSSCMNMFVVTDNTGTNKNTTCYYRNTNAIAGDAGKGYWRKYEEKNSGFYLNNLPGGSVEFTNEDSGNTYTAVANLDANTTYYFYLGGCNGWNWSNNNGTYPFNYDNPTRNLETYNNVSEDQYRCKLTTTAAGYYTFTLTPQNTRNVQVSVAFPVAANDYRAVYNNAASSPTVSRPSNIIKNDQNSGTISLWLNKGTNYISFQKAAVAVGGAVSWSACGSQQTVSDVPEAGIYNMTLTRDGSTYTVSTPVKYEGDLYIRTDCAPGKWADYTENKLDENTFNFKADDASTYDYYYCKWINDAGTNVRCVIANDINVAISDTLKGEAILISAGQPSNETLPEGANVRFSYNSVTNELKRSYLTGASTDVFLNIMPDAASTVYKTDGTTDMYNGGVVGARNKFSDLGNWVYELDVKVKPNATAAVKANYNSTSQALIAAETKLVGGTGSDLYSIRLVYDFRTNYLMSAWMPDDDDITTSISLNSDMMIVRQGQGDAKELSFTGGALSNVKRAYGVFEFNKSEMVNNMNSWSDGGTTYGLCMYYFSLPFDVNVADIFGVGTMGDDWRIQFYNGTKRAAKGWFAGDGTTTFWEDVPADTVLHAYEGYCLMLNRSHFNNGSHKVWNNVTTSAYLYFPSVAPVAALKDNEMPITVPSHECKIDRFFDQDKAEYYDEGTKTWSKGARNHKYVDSHWNLMGTPLFETANATGVAGCKVTIGDADSTLTYIYEWVPSTNSLSARQVLNTDFTFKPMYAYMVQYSGKVTFTGASITPASIAARRTSENKQYTIDLLLTKEDQFAGRTYVELRENAVDSFMLNEDMYMMKGSKIGDIYTHADGYELAANVLSVNSHIVPVSIDAKAAGTYTISMPSNFSGTVTLVDKFANTRTNLGIEDYEIYLESGTASGRFELEININNAPTAIDGVEGGSLKDGKAHKFIMNDMLYILKDGVIYDARGNRVK